MYNSNRQPGYLYKFSSKGTSRGVDQYRCCGCLSLGEERSKIGNLLADEIDLVPLYVLPSTLQLRYALSITMQSVLCLREATAIVAQAHTTQQQQCPSEEYIILTGAK